MKPTGKDKKRAREIIDKFLQEEIAFYPMKEGFDYSDWRWVELDGKRFVINMQGLDERIAQAIAEEREEYDKLQEAYNHLLAKKVELEDKLAEGVTMRS